MNKPLMASARCWSVRTSANATPAGLLASLCNSDRCMKPNTIATRPKSTQLARRSCTIAAGTRERLQRFGADVTRGSGRSLGQWTALAFEDRLRELGDVAVIGLGLG